MEGALRSNSKSANILKEALLRRDISKVLQLFRGGLVYDALQWSVCYIQILNMLIF